MVVEKGEVAVYFLDAERLLASIKAPKGPLVAVVPTANMVLFTTGIGRIGSPSYASSRRRMRTSPVCEA